MEKKNMPGQNRISFYLPSSTVQLMLRVTLPQYNTAIWFAGHGIQLFWDKDELSGSLCVIIVTSL